MKKHFQILFRNEGFSLPEIIAVTAVAGILALGTTSLLQGVQASSGTALAKQNLVQTIGFVRSNLNNTGSKFKCASVLTFDGNLALNTAGQTQVTIVDPSIVAPGNTILTAGKIIKGSQPFKVDKLYLANPMMVSSSASGSTYVAQLILESSINHGGKWVSQPAREVTSIQVNVDATGIFQDCDLGIVPSDNQAACEGVVGWTWNPNLVPPRCVQGVLKRPDNTFQYCADGMNPDASGICQPMESHCRDGYVSQGFANGLVANCVPVSIQYTVLPAGVTLPPPSTPPTLLIVGASGPVPFSTNPSSTVAPATTLPTSTTNASVDPGAGTTTTTTMPTFCRCGSTTVALGDYCVTCGQSYSGIPFFRTLRNYFNASYCATDGNLVTTPTYQTKENAGIHSCAPQPLPGHCTPFTMSCYQGP